LLEERRSLLAQNGLGQDLEFLMVKSPCLVGALVAALLSTSPALAQELTKIRFTLGWKTQGSDAAFLVAKDKGYFAEAGLDVTIDQGEGSAATVTRIMGGAYDAGFGDINAIIQNAATRPAESPVMVYMMWNRPPFAIVTKATSGIKAAKDLEGRVVGGAPGTPTTRMFPVFAKKNGIDLAKVKFQNMAPNLQEPMLIRDQIDAAMVFNITSYFNLVQNRQDPDKDYRWFTFGDHGLDLYSNGMMVSRRLIKDNPKAVAGLVRAVNRAAVEVAADQNTAMAAVQRYDNLVDMTVERRRLVFSLTNLMTSSENAEIGLGDLKDDRLAAAIGMIVEGYELPRVPAPSEVFDRSFLPPRAEREMKVVTN
jgi:NitT/TauT family transport system substrate-binding protein